MHRLINEKSFNQIKEYIKADVPKKSIYKLTGKSPMTVSRIAQCETIADYQEMTKQINLAYRTKMKAKAQEAKPQAQPTTESADQQQLFVQDNERFLATLNSINNTLQKINKFLEFHEQVQVTETPIGRLPRPASNNHVMR